LCYSQSHASRRDFLRPLDHPHFVIDGLPGTASNTTSIVHFIPRELPSPQLRALSSIHAAALSSSRACRSRLRPSTRRGSLRQPAEGLELTAFVVIASLAGVSSPPSQPSFAASM